MWSRRTLSFGQYRVPPALQPSVTLFARRVLMLSSWVLPLSSVK